MLRIWKNRLAPMRLVPRSYFWICWKVSPADFAEFLLAEAKRIAPQTQAVSYMSIDGVTGLGP